MIFIKDFRNIILYGLILAVLIFVLKWLEWKFLIVDKTLDIYIGLMALFFTVLGVWIATQLVRPHTQSLIVEKEVHVHHVNEFSINTTELEKLNLSNREYEVLQLLAQGYSNADIANTLFLSISTIKTHVSNILLKLDVNNRTQATEKAKRLKIIA